MRTTSNHFSASALTHIGSNGVTLSQTVGGGGAPGAFSVMSANNTAYSTSLDVQSANNTNYTVPLTVLSAGGVSYSPV